MFSNYTKAGLILLVLAIITLVVAVSMQNSAPSPLTQGMVVQNLTVPAHGSVNRSIAFANASILLVFMNIDNSTNVYLMNSTAFDGWSSYVNSNLSAARGLDYAISIANKGVFYIYQNASELVTIPYTQNSTQPTVPILYQKPNQVFPPGTYYLVFDNTNGSASKNKSIFVKLAYLQPISNSTLKGPTLSSVYSQVNQGVQLGIIFILLLMAGIVSLIYGYVRKLLNLDSEKEQANKNGDGAPVLASKKGHGSEPAKKEKNGGMPSDITKMYTEIEHKHRTARKTRKSKIGNGARGNRHGRKRRLK